MSSSDANNDHNTVLVEAYKIAHQTTEVGKVERAVDRVTENVTTKTQSPTFAFVNDFYTANQATIHQAAAGFASLDNKTIDNAISTFAESAKVVMKGLDALGQVHPFIGVAVVAFKLVVTLDLTRRENNQKVLAIMVQMQDMMCVLFQLRTMKDPEEEGPDGITIEDRMQPLVERIANSIRECGSACDAYLKKSFLSRALKCKIYESRLADWATTFADFATELGRSLAVHTALGVDAANEKLDKQTTTLKSIETTMLEIFKKVESPQEREMSKFIDENGGARACIEKDDLLTKLISKTGESLSSVAQRSNAKGSDEVVGARKALLKDLAEDVDEVFEKNLAVFEGKMAIQHQQITDAIGQQGQQIMAVLLSGAHEKIRDGDLQRLWKEMGWKGSVKARHFVLALQDYFTDQFNAVTRPMSPCVTTALLPPTPPASANSPDVDSENPAADTELLDSPVNHDDRWSLKYVNVAHLQPILEAIDDDGTGFISIKEANTFAVQRPKGWTLLHWLAFWAKGWHHSISKYKNQIYLLIQQMHRDLETVTPNNRLIVDRYLDSDCFRTIEQLLRSTKTADENERLDPNLAKVTDAYVKSEEERLEKNLGGVGYNIDSPATVSLITGAGRIERHIYPLLYLLLRRHARIVKVACHHIIDVGEMHYWVESLVSLIVIMKQRVETLGAIYKQVYADAKIQLENFAFGMYRLIWESPDSWKPAENSFSAWKDTSTERDESREGGYNPDDVQILHYPTQDTFSYRSIDSDLPPFQLDADAPPYSFGIEGLWTGHCWHTNIDGNRASAKGLLLVRITGVEGGSLIGRSESCCGVADVSGKLEGDEASPYRVLITLHNGQGSNELYQLTGMFDPVTQTITGTYEVEGEDEEEEGETEEEDEGDDESQNGEISETGTEGAEDENEDEETEEGVDDSESGEEAEEKEVETETGAGVGEDQDRVEAPLGDGGDDNAEEYFTFTLTRTPAELYRCRYSTEELQYNAPKARWSFACKAALYHVQKRRWTWSFLKDRMTERKSVIELRLRDWNEGDGLVPDMSLSTEEEDALTKLEDFSSPTVAGLCQALVEYVSNREAYLFRYDCNNCDRPILYPGYICLQCITPDHSNMVNLCPDCLEESSTDDGFRHDKTHSMLKTFDTIHDYHIAFLIRDTRVLIERIKNTLRGIGGGRPASQPPDSKSKRKVNWPRCTCCSRPISFPCHVCAICARDTFICTDCDSESTAVLPNGPAPRHELSHITVRLYDMNEEKFEQGAADVTLKRLEGLETVLRDRVAALDERVNKLEGKLDERLNSFEALLKKLVGEGSPWHGP